MQMMRLPALSVLIATLVAATGCASTPGVDDPIPAHELDAKTTYDAAADWLPADSFVVATTAGEPPWEQIVLSGLPTAAPDAEPGELGTPEGLQSDLRGEYVEMVGFDPTNTDALAVSASDDGISMVMFGTYDEPRGLDVVEFGDRTGYALPIDDLLSEMDFDADEVIYLLPIDDPRPGLVATTDRSFLERAVDEETPDAGLRNANSGETYDRLFDSTRGTTVGIASVFGAFVDDLDADPESVDAAALRFGDDHVGVVLSGDPDELRELDDELNQQAESSLEALDELWEADDSEWPIRLISGYGRHTLASIAGQLSPGVDGDWLDYRIEYTPGHLTATTATLMATGAAVAFVQLFVRTGEIQEEYEMLQEESSPDDVSPVF